MTHQYTKENAATVIAMTECSRALSDINPAIDNAPIRVYAAMGSAWGETGTKT